MLFLDTRRPTESAETGTSRQPAETVDLILEFFLSIIS
jgi:hypothetical protein